LFQSLHLVYKADFKSYELFPTSSRLLEWNQNKSNITGVSGAEAAQQQNYQPDLSLTPRRPKGRRTARETMEPEQEERWITHRMR